MFEKLLALYLLRSDISAAFPDSVSCNLNFCSINKCVHRVLVCLLVQEMHVYTLVSSS